ncbi:Z1 domain-containing protein [Terrisporobacter petrolearius]|uniref:Z1 domain-containing protein n=1 Tax=Terrisporobacter petrolearius TaxID=1460447 RepID=UPI001D16A707|nr:Z1 domain-containing protein [Terrisporobacter petrolearius]MCC3863903.1 Z1 domain-containing protein [Terrisporobacter petrolearius]
MQKMNSYDVIKEHIRTKLEKIEGSLEHDKIENEISNIKILVNTLEPYQLELFFSIENISKLEDSDWKMMKRELELEFNVTMSSGILIQSKEQQNRDSRWWTEREKLMEDYYWNRYKKYMRKDLPPNVIKAIDVDTDKIMDNLEDPKREQFSRHGMVVGHVQSGKTGNYAALICKAADAGYKFIVVIAGGINNLRDQTQERLNEAFIGIDSGELVGVGKFSGTERSKIPRSLTTKTGDFNKRDADKNAQGTNFDNSKSPIVLVIKKNTSTLKNVVEWLSKIYNNGVSKHAMLLIDDESDYASINTKKPEEDPTVINKRIRELLSLFEKSAYVAYTATPYANIFIDHKIEDERGKDLFPKDFIYALKAPDNYFGAKKIFLDTDFKHIVTIPEPYNIKLNHKKTLKLNKLPDTLKDAIRLFLINIGIRNLRNQGNKHNSMLIHASRFTAVHQDIGSHVEDYLSYLRKDILAYGLLSNPEKQSENIRDIKNTFDKHYKDLKYKFETNSKEIKVEWKDVIKSISELVNTVVIREVHQERTVELEYRDDQPTNAIVIGGTSLARGYTIEGLSVSYFLRNTIFYDTLMQMGRWFGYRPGYEDLCKIYMTENMRDNFKYIIEATEDLFETFDIMAKRKKTPEDFGLAVQQHPDSGLQVTARNKQRNTKEICYNMKLDGHLKETEKIISNIDINIDNIELIKELVSIASDIRSNESELKNSYLWKNIDKNMVKEFIDKFQIYESSNDDIFGIKSRMPINFIKKYIDEVDEKWDIALYSTKEKEKAKIYINDKVVYKQKRKVQVKDNGRCYEVGHRQVSSGTSESISLSDVECKGIERKDRKAVRNRLKRPLLMLHILDANIEGSEETVELAAFGISFPGGITSTGKTVSLKINTVYIEKLLKGEDYDD